MLHWDETSCGTADLAIGQHPGDLARGQHPGGQARGQHPGDQAKGQHSGDQARGQHPGDQARGQNPGDLARGQHPGDQARGQHPGGQARGQHPGDQARGQHPGDQARCLHPGDQMRGQNPGDQAIGQHPGDQARGQHPGDQAKGQHSGDQARGQHPGDQARGQHSGDQARGQHPDDQARGQNSGDQARGQHPGDQARGQHPGDQAKGQHSGDQARGQHPGDQARGQHSGDQARGQHPGDQSRGQHLGSCLQTRTHSRITLQNNGTAAAQVALSSGHSADTRLTRCSNIPEGCSTNTIELAGRSVKVEHVSQIDPAVISASDAHFTMSLSEVIQKVLMDSGSVTACVTQQGMCDVDEVVSSTGTEQHSKCELKTDVPCSGATSSKEPTRSSTDAAQIQRIHSDTIQGSTSTFTLHDSESVNSCPVPPVLMRSRSEPCHPDEMSKCRSSFVDEMEAKEYLEKQLYGDVDDVFVSRSGSAGSDTPANTGPFVRKLQQNILSYMPSSNVQDTVTSWTKTVVSNIRTSIDRFTSPDATSELDGQAIDNTEDDAEPHNLQVR